MTIKKHDVIQIHPEHSWGGCLAIVDEVKRWGVQAYVQIPLKGSAYIRLEHGLFEYVGKAVFAKSE